jgi:uncharacterized protein (DUF433 family)
MRLEDYFDFLAPDDIRIRGHRVGIESVLYEYVHRARTPEEIAERFDTLTLDQVYATILYYLRSRDAIDAYLTRWLESGERARREQALDPAFQRLRTRLRQVRASRLAREATSGAAPR